jgi:hypothetical protein
MQISSSTTQQLSFLSTATATAAPTSTMMRKFEMSGDPEIDLARGFVTTLLLTDSDRAMIEKATGVKMDAETGHPLSANVLPEAADFINALADKRLIEFQNHQPSRPLDDTSVRDLFKQAVEAGQPLDPKIMQKMLDILSDAIDSKNGAETTDKADATGAPARPTTQRIDRYA